MPIIQNYQKHQWSDKELITAKKLNDIETALQTINDGAVANTSDSLSGMLTFNNITDWGAIEAIFASGGTDTGGGEIFYAKRPDYHKWYFRHYLPDSSSLYEQYSLPPVDTTISSAKGYEILTTKGRENRAINYLYDNGEGHSVPNNSIDNVGIWTAPEDGLYILIGTAQFLENATGVRQITFSGSATSNTSGRFALVRVQAASNERTTLQITYTDYFTKNQNIYLNVYQKSGAALTVQYTGIRATKIY